MDILKSEAFWTVTPKPAFCVKVLKAKDDGVSEKIFFNFCTCTQLPPPSEDIDEDRLAVILESPDPGRYRVPISIGDPHKEEDKSGQPCTAFDVILNESFYLKRVADSELFRAFLVLIAIDGVESKHDVGNIDRRNWITLKNRKCVGELQTQKIRKQSRPMIEELNLNDELPIEIKSRDNESSIIEPKYEIRKDDAKNPTRVTATFYLSGVKSASEICLDVGEHRIRVTIADKRYEADIFLPFSLNERLAKAKLIVEDGKFVVDVPLRKSE